MENGLFNIKFNRKKGGIKLLSLKGDESKMNFCKKGGVFGALSGYKVKSFRQTRDNAYIVSEKSGVVVESKFCFFDGFLKITHKVKNGNDYPVYFTEGEFSLEMPFNDRYENAVVCGKKRCSAHIFTGFESSYVRAERMGESKFNLGMVLEKGAFSSYSQYGVAHSNRGFFRFNAPTFSLLTDERTEISYLFFPYENQADFIAKVKTSANFLFVENSGGYTVEKNEKICFSVLAKDKINDAECRCNGKKIGFLTDGNRMNIDFSAERTGENRFDFTVDGKRGYALFYVIDENELIDNRIDFIVKNQQCLDEKSPLYGAYLVYDNAENSQYFSAEHRDCNACRERLGMGISIATRLKTHKREEWRESLKKYENFILRETVDEETGNVYDDIHKKQVSVRLYNAPWVALFFCELYELTAEKRYAVLVAKILRRYYDEGGAEFYPNGIRFFVFFQALKKAGLDGECAELMKMFDKHVASIVKNGVIYPPHEVNFEQTIVTPAATIMMDKYQLSGDEFYLLEAKKHLAVLRKFDGCQPDYHRHNVPIRFWDDFWFGKGKTYGDTFPHYWSVLSGYCYYTYGKLTGDESAVETGRETVRNCSCLFSPDGKASCAYVFPFSVNDKKGEFFDDFANDQDFALYFLIKTHDK